MVRWAPWLLGLWHPLEQRWNQQVNTQTLDRQEVHISALKLHLPVVSSMHTQELKFQISHFPYCKCVH